MRPTFRALLQKLGGEVLRFVLVVARRSGRGGGWRLWCPLQRSWPHVRRWLCRQLGLCGGWRWWPGHGGRPSVLGSLRCAPCRLGEL